MTVGWWEVGFEHRKFLSIILVISILPSIRSTEICYRYNTTVYFSCFRDLSTLLFTFGWDFKYFFRILSVSYFQFLQRRNSGCTLYSDQNRWLKCASFCYLVCLCRNCNGNVYVCATYSNSASFGHLVLVSMGVTSFLREGSQKICYFYWSH
jgi:hypothetical protein